MSIMSQLVARQAPGFDPLLNPELCTLDTPGCDLDLAPMEYLPNLAGNALFVAIFALLLLVQIFFGIRHRTWGFLIAMVFGLGLELVGYVGRIQMHFNPFPEGPFLTNIVCLTIAPAFITAAIYLCLGRIVVVYGEQFSRFKPRTYGILFIAFDFVALLLQAAGGAIASIADGGSSTQDTGINIMIAGLAWQVAAMLIFMAVCLDLVLRVRKNQGNWNPLHSALRETRFFKIFLLALALATLFIFVRSVFRVAELSEGFDGKLANDEATFMILEGVMVILASMLLTVFHPGVSFQGNFANANFNMRTRKNKTVGDITPDEEMGPVRK